MPRFRSFLAILGLVAALLVSWAPGASAHQSGCHRWHSCPSDTGSYVCGDLGYSNYCPTPTTVRRTTTTVRRVTVSTTTPATKCHASYSPCVPIASDVDCLGGGGNGPAYVRGPVKVIGPDVYGLDANHNGIGCE